MARRKREEPYLPPGPARDLVDLFGRLRDSNQLRIGQIAIRTGDAPGHVSEVLRGWKAPSPNAAASIAQVLGADDSTVRRARRRAEDLKEWKRDSSRSRSRPGPLPVHHKLSSLDVRLSICVGSLFDQDTHLAVGFSDTFDPSTADDRIIHSSSIQGQLLRQVYQEDLDRLDEQIIAGLDGISPAFTESRHDKPYGKLARYPLG